MPFVTTWKALNGIMLSAINQTEKDKYLISYYLSYVGALKKRTHRYREQTGDCQRQRGVGGDGRNGWRESKYGKKYGALLSNKTKNPSNCLKKCLQCISSKDLFCINYMNSQLPHKL